ncbi:hypothetical protein PT974_07783 [Cladobotryum mycophilum]|uniref:Uncharacterized protein n=1 Tax=Cladobotryum mycophilum TaxID=491253 RepID=A0ABR0SHW0_9HYPO
MGYVFEDAFVKGVAVGMFLMLLIKLTLELFSFSKRDIYDLQHWKLNIRLPLGSLWMNLGYWKDGGNVSSQFFSDACTALLHEVLYTSGILSRGGKAGDVHRVEESVAILDLGFGCGDQTCELVRLSLDELIPGLSYIGLTLNGVQAAAASDKLGRQLAEVAAHPGENIGRDKIQVFRANAAQPQSWNQDVRLAIDAVKRDEGAKKWVLALDTLYHFSPSRQPIFDYAAQDLETNIMAFDLLLNSEATFLNKLVVKVIGLLMGCPLNAFLTEEGYRNQLITSGYDKEDIVVRDITENVFPGLVAFLERQENALRPYGISLGQLAVAKKVFGWFHRSKVLKAVIIVAKKDGQED